MSRPRAATGRSGGSGRTGRPPVTSRTEILEAARLLIDRDGWEKLSIRRLAAELGIGATTLYHHFGDKEELLIQLLNHHIVQMERPELPQEPRERIVVAALAMHDMLIGWPWAAEAVSVDGFVALLDESALWFVEEIVAGADAYGCTPEQSVQLFRSVWYYTIGEVLVRTRTARRWEGRERPTFRDPLDTARIPQLAALSGNWGAFAAVDHYPQGLRVFVDALLAASSASAS